MKFKLKINCFNGVMALPAETVDKYINEASHSDLKVLLYVFRNSAGSLETSEICEALKITAEQLKSSLMFWEKAGLFSIGGNLQKDKEPEKQISEAGKAREQTAAHRIIDMPTQYGQEEIAKKSQENAEIKFLLEAVPNQLGRLLSPSECSTLVYLYEGAGLPADVIIMLVGYCASFGKGNMRYIQKMAISWAEEGIDTHEKAENKIKQLEERRGYEGQVRSVMGINDRALTPTERQHISRWCGWKMPIELVKLAYDIGVTRTGKLSFSYINSILSAWHEKGFTTVEQARNENKKRRAADERTPSYDIDEYIRLSMKLLHDE